MIPNSLITAAAFTPNSLQSPNAWVGHLPFASWIIQEVAPKIFVELGTHTGNSYFSFCQAVVEAKLTTKCYAVDTWQGDEHAGQYGNEIFAKVNAYHQERYAGFSRLLRMTFDDAATYFTDESIELLHIDGLHTYEAVRHDFETWLPKLAPGAVVMFHDTNVRERIFGVWKLWNELQAEYPNNLEFVHSHGLGVLQLNNGSDNKKLEWLQPSSSEKQRLISYFAALGSLQLERFELNDLKQHIASINQAMAERDGQIASLSHAVAERDGQIVNLNQAVAERDGQIASISHAVAERDGQIVNLNQTVAEQNGQIANFNQAVAERDGQIASLSHAVAERDGQIVNLNQTAAEQNGQIANFNQALAERDGQIANLNHAVAERDGQIAGLNQTVAGRDQEIAALRGSNSWRITIPFRFVSRLLSGLKQPASLVKRAYSKLTVNLDKLPEGFDRDVYLTLNPDVAAYGIDPAIHYLLYGCREGRVFNLLDKLPEGFDRDVYLTLNPDLAASGIDPAIHYLLYGCREGRVFTLPKLPDGFDPDVYVKLNLDLARAGVDPTHHYLHHGHHEGRRFSFSLPALNDYSEWVRRYDTLTDQDREKIKIRINQLHKTPLISVVMPVYNPPLNMLEDAIRSVQGQLYPNWELCIADDASTDVGVHKLLQRYVKNDSRIKVVYRKKNGHISAASNSALELVNGEYVALLDQDDLLSEHALFWVADAIVDNPDSGLIYSDEDRIDQLGRRRYSPYFKSDWNPDLFLSHNMISHLGVYRTDLVRKLGGFQEGYEGSQDYDLALRCTEQLTPQQIVHIPRVLYHWRSHPGSTGLAGSRKNYALLAGERALNDHFARTQVSAKIESLGFGYRARYAIPTPAPLVSLIIPTHNGLDLIKQCIESIINKTTYKNYEILIVDNNSDDLNTLDYFASLADNKRIRILRDERHFNYSALNNAAAQQAQGEYLGLINNDIEVISPEWLEEMIGLAIQPGVGAVGARLWYPNDTLQHGGVITGIEGIGSHSHKHLPRGQYGYFGRAQLIQTMSAVTAACLVVKKSIYREVGGLDETNLKVAYNDVDFCLRVREAGYRNVWTPYAELYHHESATRGYDDTPEKQLRLSDEVLYMQKRWGDLLMNDPAYSPNLTLEHEDFSYAWPPRVSHKL